MNTDGNGRAALVMGAGRGIGRAAASGLGEIAVVRADWKLAPFPSARIFGNTTIWLRQLS